MCQAMIEVTYDYMEYAQLYIFDSCAAVLDHRHF